MALGAGKNVPEVFISDESTTQAVARMTRKGEARKIGPRLYTTNMTEPPEVIVGRNRWQVVALLDPGCVIGYRTAMEARPADDGSVFVTSGYRRVLSLPGLELVSVKGSGPVEGDAPFIGNLFMASRERFLLENLLPTKAKGRVTRSAGKKAVEDKLTTILRVKGDTELNLIRDRARKIAPSLEMDREFAVLDGMIGALLRTRPAANLTTSAAIAYANGEPYDTARVERFEVLRRTLAAEVFSSRRRNQAPGPAFYNEGFYDSYFSNYIEGTEFLIDEAIGIVFKGVIPAARPADAHDILGTYRVVGNFEEMAWVPRDYESFIDILRRRHSTILAGRPEKRPGGGKEVANQAGSSVFVAPGLVAGSLRQGFGMYRSLEDPLARALFMMFLMGHRKDSCENGQQAH